MSRLLLKLDCRKDSVCGKRDDVLLLIGASEMGW